MTEPALRLHGGPLSPFARKVTICLIELGLLDRTRLVRSVTAMIAPNLRLLDLNPLGKIPVLVTPDAGALYDSDVICAYLDAYDPGRLIPPGGLARWDVLRRTALASGAIDGLVLWNYFRHRPAEEQAAETMAALAVKTRAALAAMEATAAILADGPFDLAAISAGCFFGYLDLRFPDLDWRNDHPSAAGWFEIFSARPSARMTVPYTWKADAPQDPELQGRLYWDEI